MRMSWSQYNILHNPVFIHPVSYTSLPSMTGNTTPQTTNAPSIPRPTPEVLDGIGAIDARDAVSDAPPAVVDASLS